MKHGKILLAVGLLLGLSTVNAQASVKYDYKFTFNGNGSLTLGTWGSTYSGFSLDLTYFDVHDVKPTVNQNGSILTIYRLNATTIVTGNGPEVVTGGLGVSFNYLAPTYDLWIDQSTGAIGLNESQYTGCSEAWAGGPCLPNPPVTGTPFLQVATNSGINELKSYDLISTIGPVVGDGALSLLNIPSGISVPGCSPSPALCSTPNTYFKMAASDGQTLNTTNISFSAQDLSSSTVPVPTTAWLFGTGLIGLLSTKRRGLTKQTLQQN